MFGSGIIDGKMTNNFPLAMIVVNGLRDKKHRKRHQIRDTPGVNVLLGQSRGLNAWYKDVKERVLGLSMTSTTFLFGVRLLLGQ